ncbi:unnamed protein product [Heligmosomoides polygyrus]|uniref:BZIP domain-containing protein n=1 Tax=Heligmosomoides polygyrus TaxID=6339 RepID=A0A3P7U344_HELPZ|nr:unnamed protein product [Heligmosomoides polygyrus]
MLPVFAQGTFDPQPFAYNPYGYTVPFPGAYGTPVSAVAPAQPCTVPVPYHDTLYTKSSSSSCSKSESDVSSGSEEAYRRRREKRDRNNEAARTSRLRRKAREGHVVKEAEVLQQENQVLKDEVGELKKVLYTLQDEVRSRVNVVDVENVENAVQFQNISYLYHGQNLPRVPALEHLAWEGEAPGGMSRASSRGQATSSCPAIGPVSALSGSSTVLPQLSCPSPPLSPSMSSPDPCAMPLARLTRPCAIVVYGLRNTVILS